MEREEESNSKATQNKFCSQSRSWENQVHVVKKKKKGFEHLNT